MTNTHLRDTSNAPQNITDKLGHIYLCWEDNMLTPGESSGADTPAILLFELIHHNYAQSFSRPTSTFWTAASKSAFRGSWIATITPLSVSARSPSCYALY